MITGTYDEDGILVSRVEDYGDGTGMETTFDKQGNVVSQTALRDLPIEPEPTQPEDLSALQDAVAALFEAFAD